MKRIELGCTGHLCVAARCGWKRHTRVGNYRISSVGNYYPSSDSERETIGWDRYFETMVFKLTGEETADSEGCGCGEAASFAELDMEGYNTAGDAQAGHERMVEKYLKETSDD